MLLVIDAQAGFVGDEMTGTVERIKQCVAASDMVVATRFPEDTPASFKEHVEWDGLEEGALLPFVVEGADHVVVKPSYSAVKAVDGLLQSDESVYVVGFETDACVLATVLGLFDAGYCPVVVRDACATGAGRSIHQDAIRLLRRNIGEDNVIETADAIDRLGE